MSTRVRNCYESGIDIEQVMGRPDPDRPGLRIEYDSFERLTVIHERFGQCRIGAITGFVRIPGSARGSPHI